MSIFLYSMLKILKMCKFLQKLTANLGMVNVMSIVHMVQTVLKKALLIKTSIATTHQYQTSVKQSVVMKVGVVIVDFV